VSACLPCDLEAAEDAAVVYRDDRWSCEVADGYDVPGWFILRLRRHAVGWAGLDPEDAATFGAVSQRVAEAVQEATASPTVYFLSFGENYPHFHFLVTARPADLSPELRGAGILSLRADHRDREAALGVASEVRAVVAASA
jgi:diadenosine tetraphosphate (Ap4A) HIT family hydrolase